jgi:hypothetical protein
MNETQTQINELPPVVDENNAEVRVGEKLYLTLQEALQYAKVNETLILLRDIQIQSIETVDKDLTIDLNGHSIFEHTINNTAHCTIMDSSHKGSVQSSLNNDGTLEIDADIKGTLTNNGTLINKGEIVSFIQEDGSCDNQGKIITGTLKGGVLTGNKDDIHSVIVMDDLYYGSLESALEVANNADEDKTITLLDRHQLSGTVNLHNEKATITIDLNGNTFLQGNLQVETEACFIDTSKRHSGSFICNVTVTKSGVLTIKADVSGNMSIEGEVINEDRISGTNSNFGTLINKEDGEVTDTLISEGTIINEGTMDYLYVRGGEASSTKLIRNVTVLGGHYSGEVTAIECKAAIGHTYYGDPYEAIAIVNASKKDLTLKFYKDLKLLSPLTFDNKEANITVDMNGYELSGEDVIVKSNVRLVDSTKRQNGSLFNNVIIEEDGHLTNETEIRKTVINKGQLSNKGQMPYLKLEKGECYNEGQINKTLMSEGAIFKGQANTINSEVMIDEIHFLSLDSAMSYAYSTGKEHTLRLIKDYVLEEPLAIGQEGCIMHIDLNGHSLSGASLTTLHHVILENSGEEGTFNTDLLNKGTLVNNAMLLTGVKNYGTIENNGHINRVENHHLLHNFNNIVDVEMREGELHNKGKLTEVALYDGDTINNGDISQFVIKGNHAHLEGETPEHSDAIIAINDDYYTSLDLCLEALKQIEDDVDISLLNNVLVDKELTIDLKGKTHIHLGDHVLQGEKLIFKSPVSLDHGSIENEIQNESELENNAIIKNQVKNFDSLVNNGTIQRVNNKSKFHNTGTVDTLVGKSGTILNEGTLKNTAFLKDQLISHGKMEVISQKGGEIISDGEVEHLEIYAGLFKGHLKETNAPVYIEDTYYPTLDEAISVANTKENCTVVFNKDLTLDETVIIDNPDSTVTLDFNKHQVNGAPLQVKSRVILTDHNEEKSILSLDLLSSGRLILDLPTQGLITSENELTIKDTVGGFVSNSGHMTNYAVVNAVENTGTFTNHSSLKSVENSGTFINTADAIADSVISTNEVKNEGLIRSLKSEGKVESNGDIHFISQNDGSIVNTGTVDTLNMLKGTFKGPLHSTNAPAYIDDVYYATFDEALQVFNQSKDNTTMHLIDNVILTRECEVGQEGHSLILDLGKKTISGTPIITKGTLRIKGHETGIKNKIENEGNLTLETQLFTSVTNKGTLMNLFSIAELINEAKATNLGTISTLSNKGEMINKKEIVKINNEGECVNDAHLKEAIQEKGQFFNNGTLDHGVLKDGTLINEGELQHLEQLGGQVQNKKHVANLSMHGGEYVGEADQSNAVARIENIYYPLLEDAIEIFNNQKGAMTIMLHDNAYIEEELCIKNNGYPLTIDCGTKSINGNTITNEGTLIMKGYALCGNPFINKGAFECSINYAGEIMNSGTLTNYATIKEHVVNRGTLTNKSAMNTLLNHDHFYNEGTLGAYTQNEGQTDNSGLISDVIMNAGSIKNSGTLTRVSQKGGTLENEATVHTLDLTKGDFIGEVESTNSYARIGNHYFPYFEDALASIEDDDVTITCNDDIVINELAIEKEKGSLTIDLHQHKIDGGTLTLNGHILIMNGQVENTIINEGEFISQCEIHGPMENKGTFNNQGVMSDTLLNNGTLVNYGIVKTLQNEKSLENEETGHIDKLLINNGKSVNKGVFGEATAIKGELLNDEGGQIYHLRLDQGEVHNFGKVENLELLKEKGIFNGTAPAMTNSQCRILSKYYMTLSQALDYVKDSSDSLRIILNNDVEAKEDLLFTTQGRVLSLECNKHTLSGGSIILAANMLLMGDGIIKNVIMNNGHLENHIHLEGEVTNNGTLENRGHIVSLNSVGEVINNEHATIDQMTIKQGTLNNEGLINELVNNSELINEVTGHVASLMSNGKSVNEGEIEKADIASGLFIGNAEECFCHASIGNYHFGTLQDALDYMKDASENLVITIEDDLQLEEMTFASSNDIALTIDTNGYEIEGETLHFSLPVTIEGTGRIHNDIINEAHCINKTYLEGKIVNNAIFDNEGEITEPFVNHNQLINKEKMQDVINDAMITNHGVMEHLTHDEGEAYNEGELHDMVMSAGQLKNNGTMETLVLRSGEALSTGSLHDLTISGGRFVGKVEETNTSLRVGEQYFALLEDAIDACDNQSLVLIGDLELKEPFTVDCPYDLRIDVNGHVITGEKIIVKTPLSFVDATKEGEVANVIENESRLENDAKLSGEIFSKTELINHGEMTGRVENEVTCINDGEMKTVINKGTLTNKGRIHELINYQSLTNEGTIDDAVSETGKVNNKKTIATLHMSEGTLDTSGYIEDLTLHNGSASNSGKVHMLRLKGGHFIGQVEETDGAGAINDTYYATFEDLIENVKAQEEKCLVTLHRDVILDHPLTIENDKTDITINMNGIKLIGEEIIINGHVVLKEALNKQSVIESHIVNNNHLQNEVRIKGSVENNDFFVNDGTISDCVINKGVMANTGQINEVINEKEMTNDGVTSYVINKGKMSVHSQGVIDIFKQDSGALQNLGTIVDLTINKGHVENSGFINGLSQNNGEVINEGDISNVYLMKGVFDGDSSDIDAAASIGTRHYGSFIEAINDANKAEENVTVLLHVDAHFDELVINNPSSTITVEIDGWSLSGEHLELLSDVILSDKSEGIGDINVDIVNKATLYTNANIFGTLVNEGVLTHKGELDALMNDGTCTNDGVIHSYMQEKGHLVNNKDISDLRISGGDLINKGLIASLTQEGGNVSSSGEVKELIKYDGSFNGEAEYETIY